LLLSTNDTTARSGASRPRRSSHWTLYVLPLTVTHYLLYAITSHQ
jgi:hypothetical protein